MKFKNLLFITALGVSSIASAVPVQDIANINGEQITFEEYKHELETYPGIQGFLGSRFTRKPFAAEIVKDMINNRLILQLAKEKGLTPTEQEINSKREELLTEDKTILDKIKEAGFAESDLNYQLKLLIAQQKLLTEGVIVTDKDVTDYYANPANKEQFEIPKLFDVSMIMVTSDKDKEAVDKALNDLKGKSSIAEAFAEVAKKHTSDPNAQPGGKIGEIPATNLPPALKSELDSKKANEITNWVTLGPNHMKFLVHNVKEASVKPLDEKMKDMIKKKLLFERGKEKNDLEKAIKQKAIDSKIDYKYSLFTKDVESHLKEMRTLEKKPAEPKAAATQTPSKPAKK